MTQEEIIQLAKAYGFTGGFDAEGKILHDEAFVVAVTEAVDKTRKATLEEMIYEHPTIAIKKAVEYAVKEEREACAKVCDAIDKSHWGCEVKASWCSDAIRARGEA